MHANVALPSAVSNSVKRIETRCACYRQRSGSANVGRLREASRQNPAPEAKLAVDPRSHAPAWECIPGLRWHKVWVPTEDRGNQERLHANVALPSAVSNSVKRIETRCACYRQRSGSANVGRLREASRQNPEPEAKLAVDPRSHAPAWECIPGLRWHKVWVPTEDRGNQELVRFLSSAHPTRTGRADQAQRIRQRRAASRSKPPKTCARGGLFNTP
nr:hypothetical protein [Methylomarinum sp. Ch1-1]MDP4520985.1 hypothetical protein [Methylomarinum sp. Ch1-1]